MSYRAFQRRFSGTVAGLIVIAASSLLWADDAQEFRDLLRQYDGQFKAGQYREAEQTALAMRQIAEGPLKDKPLWLGSALLRQGKVCRRQGRHAEAEPLLKQALEITEKVQGPDHANVASYLDELGGVYRDAGRMAEAEPLQKRALAIREKALGPENVNVGSLLNNLALVYRARGRYAEAEALYKRAVAIQEKARGAESPTVAVNLLNLAEVYQAQGRYEEADPLYQRALAINEAALGTEHPDVAICLGFLASSYRHQSRYAEAEPLYKRALAIAEKVFGNEHPMVRVRLDALASFYRLQGRYAEAEPFYKRAEAVAEKALAASEKTLGPDHPDVAVRLNILAALYNNQSRYAEAEPLYKRALAIHEKAYGPEHPTVRTSLEHLASAYRVQSRNAEAELLYKRAVAIATKAFGPEHPDVGSSLDKLALLYAEEGRYAEAEPLYKRSLEILEKSFGPGHVTFGTVLNNLARLYKDQGRYAEAEPLLKRALSIHETALGPNHPSVAGRLSALASLYEAQRLYAQAEPLAKRALAIQEKVLAPDNVYVGRRLRELASLYDAQGRYGEAEPLFQRALAIVEKALGANHPTVAETVYSLARLRYHQQRYGEAEPLADRAIAIYERAGYAPGRRFDCYLLRARIAWKQDRRGEAADDLRQAMQLAEQQRSQSSGSAHERAESFTKYNDAFEQMVAWQLEVKDISQALSAMERGRARSLLDEMTQAGADFQAGASAAERETLRKRELELKEQVEKLQKQLDALDEDKGKSEEEKSAKRGGLQADLAQARNALYEYYRDLRSSSPVYRQLLSTGGGPPRLSQIQRCLAADGSLLLIYLLGEEGGYVLALTADKAELQALSVDGAAAKILQIDPGPLTAKRLATALVNEQETGVVQQLRVAEKAGAAVEKLASLADVLIPPSQREALITGKVKRLIIVPDGQLSLLPFETLVVRPGSPPQYLLDAGPPILYGPSATVLYNLVDRGATPAVANREPVLTVGNPSYGAEATQLVATASNPLNHLTARSRFGAAGGKLAPLPYSGTESQWVKDVFSEQGIKVLRLEGAEATKVNLKAQIENRRVVHLACHGMADQSHGNFYGALALAPGNQQQDPSDDGFLTLAEIYQLNLKHCELAILSACETNFGPQQQGEGVWAISRGFLVAGAGRVVASNWLVDDEAAASLMSYFCSTAAQAAIRGGPVDYAEALSKAKRWIRSQDKWSSPYYWGTFVLVGPK